MGLNAFKYGAGTHLASCDLSRRQESWRDPRDPAAAALGTPWLGWLGSSLLTAHSEMWSHDPRWVSFITIILTVGISNLPQNKPNSRSLRLGSFQVEPSPAETVLEEAKEKPSNHKVIEVQHKVACAAASLCKATPGYVSWSEVIITGYLVTGLEKFLCTT